jgi:hypothetical protein
MADEATDEAGRKDLAKQLVTYADAITAFAFVQSVAFGFALGQKDFCANVVRPPCAPLVVGALLAVAYFMYYRLVLQCRVGVNTLLAGLTGPVLDKWRKKGRSSESDSPARCRTS